MWSSPRGLLEVNTKTLERGNGFFSMWDGCDDGFKR